ncbi:cytochrome P450 315a1, mitochondrial isoform X2 [Adelges cooleyi]|uniref:cytochrome P450 315a1, mitochondrial isoform X2 n=1 Tax=Adelges cooleyi TaxID=133065 RepID=UPI00217F46F0|nr:cytochrome P450 315a1, mitochondrial isoform X2 [Adelges cooleyi]
MKYLTSISIYSHSNITFSLLKRLLSTNNKDGNLNLKSEVPIVKGLPIVGTAFSILAAGGGKKLHEYIGKRHQEYGPVFREKLGPIDAIWVSDPADMKLLFAQEGKHARHILPEAWLLYNETYGQQRGLYFMDGEEWWTYRKFLNKMMLVDSNKCFIESTTIILQDVLNKWKMFNGLLIENLETDLYRISISFMVSYLVGGVFEKCKEEVSNDINKLAYSVQQIFQSSVKFTIIPAKTAKLLKLGIWYDFVKAVDESINNANQLVSKLMEYKGDGLLKSMSTIQDVSDNMIKRLVIDFILAAGDTTAYSTQWALYTLGLYPEIQENLRKSLYTTCFWENELLNNILKEVLRLYPLAPFLTRILPYNTVLTNHIIPANVCEGVL